MWPFKHQRTESSRPPARPTAEMREEAKRNPNGWVYVIDGDYSPDEAVPSERIIGAWKVDAEGNLTSEYIANPNYKVGGAA